MIRCTCCQAEITCPQFVNGLPYGYTCVKRVDPALKRKKVVYKACDSFKVVSGEGTQRMVLRIVVDGKASNIVCYVCQQTGRWSAGSGYVQDGALYIPE